LIQRRVKRTGCRKDVPGESLPGHRVVRQSGLPRTALIKAHYANN
jgi:hypothetical protein